MCNIHITTYLLLTSLKHQQIQLNFVPAMDFSLHDCYQYELYRSSLESRAKGFFWSSRTEHEEKLKQHKN